MNEIAFVSITENLVTEIKIGPIKNVTIFGTFCQLWHIIYSIFICYILNIIMAYY